MLATMLRRPSAIVPVAMSVAAALAAAFPVWWFQW